MENNKSIFISAGDISGDIHAANLIKSIKSNSDYKVYAIGGNQLKKVADEFIQDIVNINGFGFFPIRQVFFLKKIFKTVKEYLIEKKINKVILVDYYGFNIHVAKLAHELKIPVYYFVTPQVWASRKYRIKNIAKYVSIAFPILPFEKPMYEKALTDYKAAIDLDKTGKYTQLKENLLSKMSQEQKYVFELKELENILFVE